MSLTEIFQITGSALASQSVRLNTTASNLANADSVAGSPDEVYKARYPVFQTALLASGDELATDGNGPVGVRVGGIVESPMPPVVKHDPGNPLADENGNVYAANINVVEELTNMIEASRSYETNVQVASTAKQLIQMTLRMGQS
jgi:flagellar basal-body rod protein FlgC